ncbi:MAG: helix-turn-helix transcriptional regulator [Anaeromyxobacteraceae bacterium]|nr:helix-turn-helix transcriptional regulator [Anaeromyxobacteraceae bacterium]
MTSLDSIPSPGSADHQRFWEIDPSSPKALAWPAGLFVIITFFVGADLAADLAHGMSWSHVSVELVAMLFCLAGVFGSGLVLRRALVRARELHHHLEGTRQDLHEARTEADALRAGLGTALDDQFERWGLTSAQREVALLVLKGLSYKEVAELRTTAEHTVRNQALAIFRKAGLAGRAEMAAFFIEDLLLPRDPVPLRGRQAKGESGAGGAAA